MNPPGTCPVRTRNHSNNGEFCSEPFRTDNPLGKSGLFAHHKPWMPVREQGGAPVQAFPYDKGAKAMNANEKVNILIVGKRTARLASYEVMLRELGENLILASSAEEALRCLLQTDVAVMLLDVDRIHSESDAFGAANAIVRHSRLQKTPIIFVLDAPLTDLDQYKEYRRGTVDFISTPVLPELLRNKVTIFADLHCKARQLEMFGRELDLLSEAVIVSDGDGHIEFWNTGAEALYGWRREEVLGKNLDRVLPTTFLAPSEQVLPTLTSAGQWEGTVRRHNKAGQEISVALRKVLQRSYGAGTILEMGHDISPQLQAEEALRQSERLAAIGRLAGVIAHEINNPLEAIANALFLVRSHPSLKGEAQRFARLAEEEVARIQHMTQQMLGFYRESRNPISVSIRTVVDDVLDLQARRLQINGIVVEKEYRDDMAVMGFPAELKQVFLNLIGNATQAMPHGGRLRIGTRESVDHASSRRGVRISVCDTGSGIQPQDAKRLFEPFFTTKPNNGTGLGLWVSKGIIEKYRGTIRFRSLRLYEQHVTCFSVFIPGAVMAHSLARDAVCA